MYVVAICNVMEVDVGKPMDRGSWILWSGEEAFPGFQADRAGKAEACLWFAEFPKLNFPL